MVNTWSVAQWNRLFVVVLLGGMLFIGVTRVQASSTTPAAPVPDASARASAPRIGHRAPEFTLSDPTVALVNLRDLEGQVVLINIWATWCPPCRAEMPTIQATYEQYRERGFTVLAVNQAEDATTVATFMQQFGLTFPALLDSDYAVSKSYQVRVLPSSFFVDRAGVIRAVYLGPMPRSVISGTVEQLVQEER